MSKTLTSFSSFILIFSLTILITFSTQAQTTVYTASLSGANVTPSNSSTGIGTATVTINNTLKTMRVQAVFSGLGGTVTAAHIHGPTAVAGTSNAGVATTVPSFISFPMGVTSGAYDLTYDMTLASGYNPSFITANGGTTALAFSVLKTAIADGKAYFNIHTNAFPGGEISGFLTLNCTPITWYLDADNDGYYVSSLSSCGQPDAGWTSTLPSGGSGDCNDNDNSIHAPINKAITVVNCGSYTLKGTTYTSSGNYTYINNSIVGCSSVDTLHLTIKNTSTSTTTKAANVSYTWNGTNYTSSGTYTYQTTNYLGCDSIATLNLTIYNAFVTTWKTDNAGSSNSTSITFPTRNGGYNYDIDWENDGVYDQFGLTSSVTHNYGVAGTYTVAMKGNFPTLDFSNGDNLKLLSVDHWGSIAWNYIGNAFYGCSNFNITATDAPNLTIVNDLGFLFYNATSFNGNISNWDVSHIINMSSMFTGASSFNQNIGNWNTGNVTNMSFMFQRAASFNQNIGNWNTSNVTNMTSMFSGATQFNQNLNSWNTTKVTNLSWMFQGATNFNQPIGNWNTSKVTNMSFMFFMCPNFNQNIGNWNIGLVSNLNSMFNNDTSFNQPIGNWNTSNVTSMEAMFSYAKSFNQNIGNWDVSKVTTFSGTFANALAFNQPIGNWNTVSNTNLNATFQNAKSFNQPIGNWNTSMVTSMGSTFENAVSFNQPIGNWDVSKVTYMGQTFFNAAAFNQNIGKWNIASVAYLGLMLYQTKISQANYDRILIAWDNAGYTNKG
ncbi:MAG: hypothetical protein RL065_1120, partial [Bacteroidota bacterium]